MTRNTNTAVPGWQDDEALNRFRLISPLLDDSLDEAKRIQLRREIANKNDITTRTLYRYEKSWREHSFQGLKPADRTKNRRQDLPPGFDELFQQAVQLRKEVPERSVEQIISILELEGRVAPGILKRSTLQRHLYNAGFGKKQLQMYEDARNSSSKRFCKPHRMMLIQADIKYGPMLPIGPNGKKIQTYLSSAIDDHSRFLLHSRFYDNQEETVVEDTFKQSILRHGKMDAVYFDNGTQYIATQLKLSLARLGIRIHHARPRSGKSKGKVEKFHQVVDTFLREAKLKKIKTLEELNRLWNIFIEEYYHKLPHDGIREYYESLGVSVPQEGITPLQEWNRDKRALCYLDAGVVAEAFLYHEKRKVDKGACISFRGCRYETNASLIGFEVEISYDPIKPEKIIIHYPGIEPFQAAPLKIGSFCDKNPTLPVSMQTGEPVSSRLLDALEKKHCENTVRKADAISYASFAKGVTGNV